MTKRDIPATLAIILITQKKNSKQQVSVDGRDSVCSEDQDKDKEREKMRGEHKKKIKAPSAVVNYCLKLLLRVRSA